MKLRRSQPEPRVFPSAIEAAADNGQRTARFDFDLRAEVSGQDWNLMLGEMREAKKVDRPEYLEIGANMAIMFPERRGELPIEQLDLEKRLQSIDGMRGSQLNDIRRIVACLVILFPEQRAEIIKRSGSFDEHMRDMNSDVFIGANSKVEAAAQMAIIFPDRRGEIDFSDIKFDQVLASLNKRRNRKWAYAKHALAVALLYPDRIDQIGVDDEVFAEVKQILSKPREAVTWYTLSKVLLSLAVLSADAVSVTNRGVELTNRSSIQETAGLPPRNLVQ